MRTSKFKLSRETALALGEVARARGMTQLARETGIGRDTLYKSLSGENNPSLGTILKVIRALGLNLTVKHATA
jgi:probable addiction module antidote protein